MISAALVKRDDIRAQPGLVFALFFDLPRWRSARALPASSADIPVFTARVHPRGDIFDRHQDIEFEIGRI